MQNLPLKFCSLATRNGPPKPQTSKEDKHVNNSITTPRTIISFYGLSTNRAGFYGVCRVQGDKSPNDGADLPGCPSLTRWRNDCTFFYILDRDKRLDDFRDRIIIDWGRAALSWHQKLKNKPIVEILPPGRKLQPFGDFLEFSLTHAQLKDLFENEEAHRDWKILLSNVAGVYLILAQKTGH